MCGASAVFARRARFFFAAGVRVVTESREPKTRRYPVRRTASLWLRLGSVARCEPARKSGGGQRTSKGRRQAHANHAEGARQSIRLSRHQAAPGMQAMPRADARRKFAAPPAPLSEIASTDPPAPRAIHARRHAASDDTLRLEATCSAVQLNRGSAPRRGRVWKEHRSRSANRPRDLNANAHVGAPRARRVRPRSARYGSAARIPPDPRRRCAGGRRRWSCRTTR